jgi:hypothetical protein
MTDFEKDKVLPRGTGKHTSFYRQYGMSMAEMGRRSGVTKECIRLRYQRGKPVDAPYGQWAGGRPLKTYEGKTIQDGAGGRKAKIHQGKTIQEWAKELNVSICQMTYRILECRDPHYQPRKYRLKQRQKSSSDAK